MRPLILIIAAAMLLAIQIVAVADQAYEIPAGYRLVLQTPIEVPAGKAHLWIQSGKVSSKVNHYYPACKLEVEDVLETAQTIRPDEFVIEESVNSRDPFTRGMDAYKTRMELGSERQPNVRSISCEVWDDSALGGFLTRDQIEATLKGLFSVEGG